MSSHPDVQQVRIVNFALGSVAIVVTCLRLLDRASTARLWWDDTWALITMFFLVGEMAAVEVHLQPPDKHSMSVKIAVYYMCAQFFYGVTWSARLSILLTVIRLSFGTFRRWLVYAGMVFIVVFLILFAQIWWVCEGSTQWKKNPDPQCILGIQVVAAQVITDVACDAFLIIAPLRLVYKASLSRPQRIRLMALFSTTIISTIVSINHAYFILKTGGLLEAMAAVIQCTISLIVANLSVIIAFFFRIKTEEEDSRTDITPVPYFSLSRRPAVPITSTFMTTNGGIRGEHTDGYNSMSTAMTSSKMDTIGTESYQFTTLTGCTGSVSV